MILATISLTLHEAHAIRDYVRRHQEYGVVWDRKEELVVHKAVLYLEAHRDETYDLAFDEDALWRTEQQIPPGLMVGTVPVGRNLLLKVMAALALLETAGEESHDDDRPTGESLPPFMERLEPDLDAAWRLAGRIYQKEEGT